jgi:hypothetical protein
LDGRNRTNQGKVCSTPVRRINEANQFRARSAGWTVARSRIAAHADAPNAIPHQFGSCEICFGAPDCTNPVPLAVRPLGAAQELRIIDAASSLSLKDAARLRS